MNANVWWVAAVPVALLAGCQTLPSAPLAPYARRDLTVPWSERTYWAHPDGGVAARRPALRPPSVPTAGPPTAAPAAPAVEPVPSAWPEPVRSTRTACAPGSC